MMGTLVTIVVEEAIVLQVVQMIVVAMERAFRIHKAAQDIQKICAFVMRVITEKIVAAMKRMWSSRLVTPRCVACKLTMTMEMDGTMPTMPFVMKALGYWSVMLWMQYRTRVWKDLTAFRMPATPSL